MRPGIEHAADIAEDLLKQAWSRPYRKSRLLRTEIGDWSNPSRSRRRRHFRLVEGNDHHPLGSGVGGISKLLRIARHVIQMSSFHFTRRSAGSASVQRFRCRRRARCRDELLVNDVSVVADTRAARDGKRAGRDEQRNSAARGALHDHIRSLFDGAGPGKAGGTFHGWPKPAKLKGRVSSI